MGDNVADPLAHPVRFIYPCRVSSPWVQRGACVDLLTTVNYAGSFKLHKWPKCHCTDSPQIQSTHPISRCGASDDAIEFTMTKHEADEAAENLAVRAVPGLCCKRAGITRWRRGWGHIRKAYAS